MKDMALPAFVSGIFGVTEPCIYGITLPKKKPFVISCIASAIGGGIIGFFGVKSFMMGGLGVFGLPVFIGDNTMKHFIVVVIAMVIAMVIAFVATYATYKDDAPVAEKPVKKKGEAATEVIASPLKGEVKELSEVNDEAFSGGILGQGLAILPIEGKLYAPCNGEITTFFPTGHAIGISSENGAEILIHVGMDTVKLDGEGFTKKKNQGDKVKKGELLLEFDIDKIKGAGYDIITPMIITNSDDYSDVIPTDQTSVAPGDDAITVL